MEGSNNKKNRYILFGLIGVLIVAGLATLGISLAMNDGNDLLKNQIVDGLSFENAKIEYKDKVSTFSVIVYNENKDLYDAKEILINFVDEDNETITLTSNVEVPLEADEGRLITATIDKDITNMKSLDYKINK